MRDDSAEIVFQFLQETLVDSSGMSRYVSNL